MKSLFKKKKYIYIINSTFLEKKRLKGKPKNSLLIPMTSLTRRWSQALLSCMVVGQETQTETREIQTECKEKLFHHKDSNAVEQVAQRGCAASSLGNSQDLTG